MQQTVQVLLRLVNGFSGPAGGIGNSVGKLGRGMMYLNQTVQLVQQALRGMQQAWGLVNRELIGSIQAFKQAQLSIGGALAAFELVPTFQAGTKAAASLFNTLEQLAAPLPGSVDDFLQVFQTSLPLALDSFREKGKASLKDIANFTSRFAAVAIANGIQAVQVASDLPRILGGTAGVMLPTFRKMLPLIRKAGADLGIAIKGSKDLNKLTAGERLSVMQQVIKLSGGAINAFENTIGAASGTLESFTAALKRAAGKSIYDAYLQNLRNIVGFFEKNETTLLAFAKTVGDVVTGAFNTAMAAMGKLSGVVTNNPLLKLLFSLVMGGGAGIGSALGPVMQQFFNIGLQQFNNVINVVSGALTLLAPVFGVLAAIVQWTITKYMFGVTVLGSFLSTLAQVVMPTIGFVFSTMGDLFNEMRPIFTSLMDAAMSLGNSLAKILGPILNAVFLAFGGLMIALKYTVIPVVSVLALVIKKLAEGIASFVNWLAGFVPGMRAISAIGTQTKAFKTDKMDDPLVTKNLFGAGAAGGLGKRAKTPKKRGGTTYDFRHSKFDITQKFAEGFDPDRLAVAFASDLATLGEMRTQSNLSPVFAVR